jgi:hypothetical protein
VFCQIITLFGLTSQRVGGFWKYSEDKVGIGALVIIEKLENDTLGLITS